MLGSSESLRHAGIHIGLKLEGLLELLIVVNANRRIRAQRIRNDCKSPLWIFPIGIFVAGHEEAREVVGCALYLDMVFDLLPPEDEIEPKVLLGNVVGVGVRKAFRAIMPLDCLLCRFLDLLAMFGVPNPRKGSPGSAPRSGAVLSVGFLITADFSRFMRSFKIFRTSSLLPVVRTPGPRRNEYFPIPTEECEKDIVRFSGGTKYAVLLEMQYDQISSESLSETGK